MPTRSAAVTPTHPPVDKPHRTRLWKTETRSPHGLPSTPTGRLRRTGATGNSHQPATPARTHLWGRRGPGVHGTQPGIGGLNQLTRRPRHIAGIGLYDLARQPRQGQDTVPVHTQPAPRRLP
jgi:hypothetical protein